MRASRFETASSVCSRDRKCGSRPPRRRSDDARPSGAGRGARRRVPRDRGPDRRRARKPRLPLGLADEITALLSRRASSCSTGATPSSRSAMSRWGSPGRKASWAAFPERRSQTSESRATAGLRRDDARGRRARTRPRGDRRLPQDRRPPALRACAGHAGRRAGDDLGVPRLRTPGRPDRSAPAGSRGARARPLMASAARVIGEVPRAQRRRVPAHPSA